MTNLSDRNFSFPPHFFDRKKKFRRKIHKLRSDGSGQVVIHVHVIYVEITTHQIGIFSPPQFFFMEK